MLFRGKKLETLTASDIQVLVENKVGESRILDYKREIKLDERGKTDLLYDITAFYNTEGGCIVVGLSEEKDTAGKNTSVPQLADTPAKVANYDQLKLHVQSLLRDATNPAIGKIVFSPLISVEGHDIFVIGIPVTENLPAMVKYGGMSRFYKRSSSGNYMLDTYELAELFTKATQREQKILEFIKTRGFQVFMDDIYPGKSELRGMLLHIVPMSSFQETAGFFFDMDFMKKASPVVALPQVYGYSPRYCFEGIHAQSEDARESIHAYSLLFRNCTLETFTDGVFYFELGDFPAMLKSYDLLDVLREQLSKALDFYREHDIQGPYLLSLSFNNMQNFSLLVEDNRVLKSKYPGQIFTLPHCIINDDKVQIKEQVKRMMDILFQAFNSRECPTRLFDKYFNKLA